MTKWITRTLLAAMGLAVSATTYAVEGDLRFSELDQRLAALESRIAAQQGVQSATYVGDAPAAPIGEDDSENDASENGDSEKTTNGCGCATSGCCCSSNCGSCDCCGTTYGYYEMLWIRPHVNEDFAGKLAEEHQFSSRLVLGYEDGCGIGARVRGWFYDHSQDVLATGDTVRFGMDVVDVEATNHVWFQRTDVILGGGLRVASLDLADGDGDRADNDALGITMAADIRTRLFNGCMSSLSWVYGGRAAILGGDWEGDNDFVNTVGPARVRDDNLFVSELYAGLEYGYAFYGWDLFSRVEFEMQNWRSDVLGQLSGADSISFVGPGVSFGVNY